MKLTQTRYAPHKRARIRAFFAEGVEKLRLPWAVEALPALLHLSLFLFFAGLAVYLFNINHTIFKVAISWIGLCTGMYMWITFMPILWHDSPYYAPLSSSPWYLYTGTLAAVFRFFIWVTYRGRVRSSTDHSIYDLWETYLRRISRGMEKRFEETAFNAPSGIDGRALMWTYESLDEDHELEQFFAGIPGFYSSKVVDNSQSSLDSLRHWTVAPGFNELLERTWSSNLVPETIKQRRLMTCVKAIDAAYLHYAAFIIFERFFDDRPALLRSVELGHSLIYWGNNDDGKTGVFSQVMISCIISNVQQRNVRWFSLTMHHLGISDDVLRSYLDHGNSVLLAILIHFIHHFVHNSLEDRWPMLFRSHNGWPRLDFDVQNTLPGLQHAFCGLWNKVVRKRRDRASWILSSILEKLRTIYETLHQGSTLTDEYHLCSIPANRKGFTSILTKSDVDRPETARAAITTSPAPHHHDTVPYAIPPATKCDAPLSLMSNLDDAIPHIVDEQSRNGVLADNTPAASSFRLAPLDNDRVSDDTATPSFVPDSLPSPVRLLTVCSDPAATHISGDPTVSQPEERSSEDRSTPHPPSPSQNFTPLPLAFFDSNAATEMGPLDSPDHTLNPNRHVMSQSLTSSSPGAAEYSLRSDNGDPSGTSSPPQ